MEIELEPVVSQLQERNRIFLLEQWNTLEKLSSHQWKEGAKVVRFLSKKKGSSLFCSSKFPGFRVYELGQSTAPPVECGPLSVFETEVQAWKFIERFIDCLPRKVGVMKVRYLPTLEKSLWVLLQERGKTSGYIKKDLPEGTRLALRVHPVGWSICPNDWLHRLEAVEIYPPPTGVG